jgi:hypothetical protein
MTKIIEITVSPKGETTVQTKGFVGSACQQGSKFVEDALGLKATEQLTAEFHQASTNAEIARQQAGQ